DRSGIDDRSTTALDEMGQGIFHSEPYPAEIDRDYAIKSLLAELSEKAAFALDAGVVVLDVQSAIAAHGLIAHRTRVLRIGYVGSHCERVTAVGNDGRGGFLR